MAGVLLFLGDVEASGAELAGGHAIGGVEADAALGAGLGRLGVGVGPREALEADAGGGTACGACGVGACGAEEGARGSGLELGGVLALGTEDADGAGIGVGRWQGPCAREARGAGGGGGGGGVGALGAGGARGEGARGGGEGAVGAQGAGREAHGGLELACVLKEVVSLSESVSESVSESLHPKAYLKADPKADPKAYPKAYPKDYPKAYPRAKIQEQKSES